MLHTASNPQNWAAVADGLEECEVLMPSQPVHEMATYRCDDTRGCVMQFWPPDDAHICSKHVEAWNKLIVKQKFCATSWLITEIKYTETHGQQNVKKQNVCFDFLHSFCLKHFPF